ncbi:MAG: hypothetical protein HYS57_00450 [Parcubacteria group bacterium]|nr:hypothetical protein [Parcubacteria group bacterium]
MIQRLDLRQARVKVRAQERLTTSSEKARSICAAAELEYGKPAPEVKRVAK